MFTEEKPPNMPSTFVTLGKTIDVPQVTVQKQAVIRTFLD